ncbi:MAG: DciA family protein [Treponema sp.]
MSEQNVVSASEMINRVFSNIDVSQIEKGNSLANAWKETVGKIYKYGEKLVCHSQIVDLKNGILLVETDHPGWNQILQNNKNFILKGLRLNAKDVEIKSLAFRVKGNDAHLAEDYEAYKKRINDEYFAKIEEDEKKLEQMGFKNEIGKTEIPQEVKELFKGFFEEKD